MNTRTFEDWLQEMFIAQGEYRGIPVTKDNFENAFDNYLSNLDGDEYLEFGTTYGKIQFLEGEKAQIKERIEKLEQTK